ncbi:MULTISPECIES: hypothetical protein [unclassified Streptomyces]|uniref:hypothetical protein n=1 Tax=unclassified Streptomyces TaxID=2593676 RepID=UPI0022504EA9|nr:MULTISPECIES: hypothetical protein [unclassified Streptomyces]MCX4529585.1 hypothetical protein [Streptomyces sp. NBC_01551]MCX4539842.1 hypothetical protein [Streptomyces sp. NBC_01565]
MPPVDGTVCGPDPPSSQLCFGVVRGAPTGAEGDPEARVPGAGEREALVAETEGEELCGPEAEGEADALAEAEAEPGPEPEPDGLGEGNTVGADRATGGFGRVEPATKSTVAMTAVTLAAVQETHMSR